MLVHVAPCTANTRGLFCAIKLVHYEHGGPAHLLLSLLHHGLHTPVACSYFKTNSTVLIDPSNEFCINHVYSKKVKGKNGC